MGNLKNYDFEGPPSGKGKFCGHIHPSYALMVAGRNGGSALSYDNGRDAHNLFIDLLNSRAVNPQSGEYILRACDHTANTVHF